MTHTHKVGADAVGQRLDAFAASAFDTSRAQVQRWLAAGAISVNDWPERASYRVTIGDCISLTVVEPGVESPRVRDLPIIYQDNDLLVIDKPADIAVHSGNGRAHEATVADFVRRFTTDPDSIRPGIVHRLDRETSGLLVVAKTLAAKTYLQALWQSRKVEKTYALLAVGNVQPPAAKIQLPLGRDPIHPTRRSVRLGGRLAVTHYKTMMTYPGYSYLEAKPTTGRTHQIRVHFAALGHAIAGDVVYGPARRPLGLRRHFLHAAELSFVAPSGQQLQLSAPLPPDLAKVLTSLDKSYN